MEKTTGYYAPDPMPRWKRWLQRRLFPRVSLQPGEDMNGFAPGEILTVVVVTVSWPDRLRLLVSGRISLDTRHRTDVHVERIVSRSQFNVEPPSFLQ